jgi:hypothetical protein
MSLSADRRAVYLGDAGDGRYTAGSGVLYRYPADLSTFRRIDLSAESGGEGGPTIISASTSRDATTVYVLIGNRRIGPLFPGQSVTVLGVDAETGAVKQRMPVGGFAGGPLVVQ